MTEHTKSFLDGSDIVSGVIRENGECDAETFIRRLEPRYQARFQRWFEYLRDGKPIKNPENLRHLSQADNCAVWELKSGGYRLYMVAYHGKWYATHGVKKLQDKRVNAEIDKSLNLFLDRVLSRKET